MNEESHPTVSVKQSAKALQLIEEWGSTIEVLTEALDWLDRYADQNPDPALTHVISRLAVRIMVLRKFYDEDKAGKLDSGQRRTNHDL